MHRLEITGATPEELTVNALKMLSMLVRGSAAITQPAEPANGAPSEKAEPEAIAPVNNSASDGAAKVEAPKRGRRASKAATADLNDDIPDLTGGAKTIEHDPKEVGGKPPLTLDGDIRPRLRAIQKAYAEKGTKIEDCVSIIVRDIYGQFGILKADQLPPERFAEFMDVSAPYLKGEIVA